MAERLDTAAVLGAGVMGAGIAAHLAGAGVRTHLLDIVPPDLKDRDKNNPEARNGFARSGIDKALKSKPATFYDPDAARLVVPGNFEDHLDRLGECDLIIEAVVEKLEIKKSLFAKVAAKAKPTAILASNTSGRSIAGITADLPEAAQKRFVVMHFFNPVRYMRLLEIVPGPKTDKAVIEAAARIGLWLGKGIVYGKDTPNFVANRIGVYGLMKTIQLLGQDGYSIEEVDKIVGKPMGRPGSAAFGTGDLVGIDTFVHVAQNCYDSLPKDEEREVFKMPAWVLDLVKSGRTGRKAGGGFYKKVGEEIQVLDVGTGKYRPQAKIRYESLGAAKGIDDSGARLKALVNADDRAGKLAWKLTAHTLAYSARRLGEIADDVVNVDRAMRWGFNWDQGPFEAWDAIGVAASTERMVKEGVAVPKWVTDMLASGQKSFYDGKASARRYFDLATKKPKAMPQDARHIQLAAVHDEEKRVIKENLAASLLDLGNGCLCVEVHTKMNTIDADVLAMLQEGVDVAEKSFEAMVIANDGECFGAGANLMLIFMASQQKRWEELDRIIRMFHHTMQKVRYAKVPSVAAPFGYTFGGVCELAMSTTAAEAHAETYVGLVEVGAGVIPAGTGCTRLVERFTADVAQVPNADPLYFIAQAFLNIATAKVATGAEEARRLRYLRQSDGITLNRDQLTRHACERALGLARAGYRPPRPPVLKAAGVDVGKTLEMQAWGMAEGGFATPYDLHIAKKVAHILTGGNVAAGTELSESHYLDLEREAFLSLCGEEKSQARMQSLLTTNKPLRN
ncbi:MAG: 3-hydroxyacyl-CoA dehydrogenase/enoyl-CoA hydratase family protein [Deltaproteobacteria bacterium]|nr:3-hydroxyacyl-CoA dehydrogenase/enoyl-CoA hydratase family protein [Deltaproteobacteria bacterium]